MAKRKSPTEDAPLVDRVEAGLSTDPADWMEQGIADEDRMNEPESAERGESVIMKESGGGLAQSATEMLIADHARLNEMFEQYQAINDSISPDAQLIAEQVCTELSIHAQIEEEIFYPAVKAVADEDTKAFIEDSLEEHETVKSLISELRALETGDPTHDATFRILMDEVIAHAEEEEAMLLPYAEEMLDNLTELAQEMYDRKEEILSSGEALFPSGAGTMLTRPGESPAEI